MRARREPLWLVLGALAALSCQGRTSLLVRVEADPELSSPENLDGLRIEAVGSTSGGMHDRTFPLTGPFPHTYRLFPYDGFPEEDVTITVRGLKGETEIVRQARVVAFAPNSHAEVTLHLHAACAGIDCPFGVPCAPSGECSVQNECTTDAQCDDQIDCTRDTCQGRFCFNEPADDLCPEGEVCHTSGGCAMACPDDTYCNDLDGSFCNGVEECVGGRCIGSQLAGCDDSDACTTDTCDEDGDGCTNERRADACAIGTSQPCTTTCGTEGSQTCTPECVWDACVAPAEVCNGVDDDCDASTDEGFQCAQGSTDDCTTQCGSTGSRACSGVCIYDACMPPADTCNGADDDCNGTCDDGQECCQNTITTCTTSCNSTGTSRCGAGCTYEDCVAPAETCNGVDDDCDGTCDNGSECCQNTTVGCATSCGSTGTQPCDGSCRLGTCTIPPETCNGVDDNCDGTCDNGAGMDCCRNISISCATSCDPAGVQTGTQACSSSCLRQGPCVAPPEDCTNGRDDNCVGGIDCADPDCATTPTCMGTCMGCPGENDITLPGGRLSVTLGPDSHAGSCGGDGGSEGYLRFTVAAQSDVFITTHGAGVDTVLYLRSGTMNCCGTELACNDDADAMSTSVLRARVAAGTYHLFIDTKAAISGQISVDVFIEAPGTLGDRCANAIGIPAGTTLLQGVLSAAAGDYQPQFGGTGCPNARVTGCDRVYYFYLPTSTTVRFNGCTRLGTTSSLNGEHLAYIRNVCTESASQAACHDDCGTPNMICNNGRRDADVSATIGPGLFYFVSDGIGSCGCTSYEYVLSGL